VDLIHYEVGMKYFQEKEYDRAIEEFRKMLTLDPGHAESYYQIGLAWQAQDRHALGIYNLKKAAKYNPENPDIFLALAASYKKNGEVEKALASMRKGIDLEMDPEKKKKYESQIGELLGEEKQAKQEAAPVPAKAEKPADAEPAQAKAALLEEVPGTGAPAVKKTGTSKTGNIFELIVKTTHNESSADPQMKPIIDNYNRGHYGKTLAEARKLLKKKPGHAGAYYYGGIIRRYNKENQKAIYNFKRALSYPDRGYNAHFFLGLTYEEMDQAQDAIREYEKYINKTSYAQGKNQAKAKISVLLKKLKKKGVRPPAVAETEYRKKSPFRFKTSTIFSFIIEDTLSKNGRKMLNALDLFLDEKYDASLTKLQELYRDTPRDALADNALYSIGLVYSKMRLWDNANKYLGQVVNEFSNSDVDRSARLLRGHVLAQKGLYDSTIAIYDKYLRRYPQDQHTAFINSGLGDIAFRRNDTRNALRYYLKALGKEKGETEMIGLKFKIGECYWRQESNRGIAYFKQAAEAGSAIRSQAVMESCFRLGDFYYKVKDMESALKYYKQSVEKFPNAENATWALYQIGNIYKNGGQYEQALQSYQKLIDGHPNDYWAVQAKWKKEDAVWQNEYREVLK
jgi:tetratricopeptide (TPR) repeat protein